MCRCIETIRVESGRVMHLEYHQRRINAARAELFPRAPQLRLHEWVPRDLPRTGLHKLRIVYGVTVETVEVVRYRRRRIRALVCVAVDQADYRFKWEDRSLFDRLMSGRQPDEDIIIVRDGCMTDSCYANLALQKDGRWVTPDTPLLAGTARQRLLDSGRVTAEPVRAADLAQYSCVSLINAMNDIGDIVIPIHAVRPLDAGRPV